jgi:hypothetical protein
MALERIERLPDELKRKILEYRIRPDWKTCCIPVSRLILEVDLYTKNYIHYYGNFDSYEIEELVTWTLYGRIYILDWMDLMKTMGNWYAKREPLCPPPSDLEFREWYRYQIQWISG